MQPLLYADLETYSKIDLKQAGAFRYAEDAEVLLFGYAVDDAPARVWECQRTLMPADLKQALDEVMSGKRKIVFHNGMLFDVPLLHRALNIQIPLESVIDTMVLAYQHGLIGALGDLSVLFRMPADKAKLREGDRLVRRFCMPQKYASFERWTAEADPFGWAGFVRYCKQDVEAERELYKKLPKFNATEWEHRIQVLDAEINYRGIGMDVELAKAAIASWESYKKRLAKKTQKITGRKVLSAAQTAALSEFIEKTYDRKLETLRTTELESRIEDPTTPEPMKELLRIRLQSTRTSTQKFKALLNAVNSDGRIRGCLQFRGAFRTGRWSGRRLQPQNMPRPSMSNDEINFAIDCLKDGTFSTWFENPSAVLPNLIRGVIVAPKGKKLVVADYSNVEGRVLAWLAGEEWKLQAFRDFDAGHGHDLYKVTYGKTFNVDPGSVTKPQRQMGKVLELALGYGGGAGAFVTFASGFGIDLNALARSVKDAIAPMVWREAWDAYDFFLEKKLTAGLEKEVFVACDAVKRAWRSANSKIVEFWSSVGDAVSNAVTSGVTTQVGVLNIGLKGNYLVIQLPSGRYLSYPSPRIEDDGTFTYMGLNSYAPKAKKWQRIRSYGPKVVENITQSVACDLLAEGLLRLDAAGYKTVLTVHDEAICEVPDTPEYSFQKMEHLMAALPDWAPGLPLVAAGYEAHRYRKD